MMSRVPSGSLKPARSASTRAGCPTASGRIRMFSMSKHPGPGAVVSSRVQK